MTTNVTLVDKTDEANDDASGVRAPIRRKQATERRGHAKTAYQIPFLESMPRKSQAPFIADKNGPKLAQKLMPHKDFCLINNLPERHTELRSHIE